jgi:DNA-binding IclR family transcriptional regulator
MGNAFGASPPGRGRREGAVQSVHRAMNILELLAQRGASGVTEIAAHLGVHKTTAFRLISVLEGHQLVEQVADRGKYHLGLGIIRLAGATAGQLDLTRESKQVCERLASELGETVNVAVLEESWVINISQARSPAAIASHNWEGRLTPPHATSNGKVLLAFRADGAVDRFLARPLQRYTSRTVTSADTFRAQLEAIREQGYGTAVEELEIGLNAVAAPIRAADGDVIAAISVSGPSYRLDEERLRKAAVPVMAAAAEISQRLGYGEPLRG